ncbi:MAG: cupin domain-containing protein [Aquificae bacterium]|nr:cupin domain-containing protein [Aquificota bacterium]
MERVKLVSTGLTDEREVLKRLKEEGYAVYVWEDPPGTYYPTHTHPGKEVRWVLEGEVVIGAEGKELRLKPGDRLELEPGTPHWARTEKGVRYACGTK